MKLIAKWAPFPWPFSVLNENATWHFFTSKNSKYNPSKNVRGHYFPQCDSLGHIAVTKIWVHSLIDAKDLSRTTLATRTDIYQNLSSIRCPWFWSFKWKVLGFFNPLSIISSHSVRFQIHWVKFFLTALVSHLYNAPLKQFQHVYYIHFFLKHPHSWLQYNSYIS